MSPDGQDLTQLHTFPWCFKNVLVLHEDFLRLFWGFLFYVFHFFVGADPVFRFSHFRKIGGLSEELASVEPLLETWGNQSHVKTKNYCTSFLSSQISVMELLL